MTKKNEGYEIVSKWFLKRWAYTIRNKRTARRILKIANEYGPDRPYMIVYRKRDGTLKKVEEES